MILTPPSQNFLIPEHTFKHSIPATAAIMSGVTPESTTAELAQAAPLEHTGSDDLPGAFPETPALESPNKNVSINPIPHTEGVGNPIKLAAGEKVPEPSTITTNTINSTVKLDKESYENGESAPPVLPFVITPQNERDLNGTGILNLPPITSSLIPESSLPMGTDGLGTFDAGPTIQSAAPMSTTAQLAAAVPLESAQVPETVVESQREAGVDPAASDIPAEVQDKSDCEKELLKEVPEAPATSEGTAGQDTVNSENGVSAGEAAAAAGGAAVAVGGVVTAAAYAAKEGTAVEATTGSSKETPAESTPEVVKESMAEAGQSPEAAAYTQPIAEKNAVEEELLSEAKPEQATAGEPAPKIVETPAHETPAVAPPPNTETVSSPTSGLNADASTAVAGKSSSPDSRDISPSTVPGTHTQTEPVVTTGVNSSSVAPVTPAKDIGTKAVPTKSNGSKDTASDKKKKRRSFFGRIKDKFTSNDKDKSSQAN